MRLETIKMAGFKSFVDPTTLHLPTNLSGVVGPNGCGKSNIIDAVRWVMGESAASRLRGDSLTDVIFAGSSARKPVGQATVELLFDNSDGTIEGEYAQFNQISVKRSVSRDGTSQYFLNGSRCRRRDITDLFLGTGLGARSYSIIEQGVISDIVEAHPDQLRNHLEEAAGISRYKERRRETENRIRHTRENIDRIEDIREEVDKQLERLTRQAKAAERWQTMKQELNLRQAELHAIQFRQIKRELDQHGSGLSEAQLTIDKNLAEQRRVEAELESRRQQRQEAGEALNKVQARGYQIGADIARIEQQIRHNSELRERLQKASQETAESHADLSRQAQSDSERIAELEQSLGQGEPESETLASAESRAGATLEEREQALATWQQRWQEHNEQSAEAARATEVERTRLDYLDREQAELGKRHAELGEERQATDLPALEAQAEKLAQDHAQAQQELESHSKTLADGKAQHETHLREQRALEERLAEARQRLSTGRGRLASLEALQSAALGRDQNSATEWLESQGLDASRRLGSVLDVNAGWETAVETVLHGLLEGVLAERPLDHAAELDNAGQHDLALLSPEAGEVPAETTLLAAQVRGPAPVMTMLARIHGADDVEQAQRMLPGLPQGHGVITRDGVWLEQGMVRVLRAADRQAGVLAREREMQALAADMKALADDVESMSAQLQHKRDARQASEQALEESQHRAHQLHRRVSELAGELNSRRGHLDSARSRLGKLVAELESLAPRKEELEQQNRETRGRLEAAIARMQQCEEQRRAMEDERRGLLEQREEARLEAREIAEKRQRHAIGMESRRSTLNSLRQGLERTQKQIEQLQARKQDIERQLAEGNDPVETLEKERQQCLDQRLEVDRELVAARKILEQHDEEQRNSEQQRAELEQKVSSLREEHSEKRLAEQALRMRSEQLSATISEAGLDTDALLAELDEQAGVEDWQGKIESLERRIERLEPVNLAAIQEHEEQAQRKQYLDAQLEDLTTALDTLETAIRKIDRETRSRFKETFDKVNTGLQALFPRLFGGGHAYLELTGDDLLSAGVAIMVRPPGKRISNISLLSGGEKAVTAVALVFAIFQLNPAPFCILDEVDAPMDEANVGRFTDMVVEMSEKVQFIVVTHNKSTMESVQQLCGVTMREPGVSRLVLVDVAEAAKLAGAA
ncbi:MAG: chromosome segregation protein SMC [Rhodanobacteraceae bacterium]